MATLINGDGNQAVYAAQDADMLSGAITNNKTVILDVGEKFSADVLSSSIIEVHDGVILTKEGRRIQLDQNAVDLFEFPAGAQGVVSWYYIGYKLEIDEDSHQICSTFVQKMDSEGDTIPEGSFRDGDQEVYISLYHVQQDTLGVLTPTLVLTENMTMIDVLDNLIGSASDLPDPTKTVTKNIEQINSDLTDCIKKSSLVGSVVNIENYTSDYFICPKNGYIRVNGGSLVVRGESSDVAFINVPLGQIVSTFVPEGMQVKVVSMITNGNARYIPWI
jgi:hypothetical protein